MAPQKIKKRTKTVIKPDYRKIKLQKKQAKLNEYILLEEKIKKSAPPTAAELAANPSINYTPFNEFKEFPLSERTLSALTQNKFTTARNVQQLAIPHALAGRNCVINARTGSGKTLAYAIPVIENLWREGYLPEQGLGAIVIVPTKELAIQVYDVFRKVGANHELSLGVIFGGKSREEEASRLQNINILIATPGRLLEHLDRTAGFDTDALKVLVIDEADRIMDMGFTETLNNILASLTPARQTILSSATPIVFDSIDISKVFNTAPEYVDLYVGKSNLTPDTLRQYYSVVAPELKLSYLFSFISQHKFARTIVFVSTCRQVKFIEQVFNKSNLGIPISSLSGKMSMQGRLARHAAFENWKFGVMICTDVASRGLDFTNVSWVVQLDAPENMSSYVHRVGRTARSSKGGNSLLVLCEFELKFLHNLSQAKVPIKQVAVREGKITSLDNFVAKCVKKDDMLLEWARKAIAHYLKALYMTHDKDQQIIAQIDLLAFAHSYGLDDVPQIEATESANKARRLEELKQRAIMNSGQESSTSFKVEKDEKEEGLEIKLKNAVNDYQIDEDDSNTLEMSATPTPMIYESTSETSEAEKLNAKLQQFAEDMNIDDSSSE